MKPPTHSGTDGSGEENASTQTVGQLELTKKFPLVGQLVEERYRISRLLGQGGFGIVFEAFDQLLARKVALKFFHPDRLLGVSLERLRREVNLAQRLHSRRLVKLYQLEASGRYVFLVLELVEGRDLRALLNEEGPLPVREAISIAAELLRALRDLHQEEIVHRDVKPANILIDMEGRIFLTDLGLAKPWGVNSNLTESSAILGTPAYLFPEYGKAELTAAADLYSFGVVLFEMLAGRLPFEGKDPVSLVKAHIVEPAPDIREFRPEVPSWLALLIAKLLEKHPSRRYQNADEVLQNLAARRTPPRFPTPLLAVALLLVVSAAAGVSYRRSPGKLYQVQKVAGTKEFEATDSKGRVLWTKPSDGVIVKARLRPGADPSAVGVVYPEAPTESEQRLLLRIFDGATGNEIDQIRLFNPAPQFEAYGFSSWYTVSLKATDLNKDGADEIWITHDHQIYWPSVTQLYRPDTRAQRPVLSATGRQTLIGSLDVDGDGLADPIFAGINNLLGFRMGIVAVRLDPPLEGAILAKSPGRLNLLPNDPASEGHKSAPLWYTLLPHGTNTRVEDIDLDPLSRTIRIRSSKGEIELDAFGRWADQSIPSEARILALSLAYSDLRRADRLAIRTQFDTARRLYQSVVEIAQQSGEPSLAVEVETRIVELLVAEGRFSDAERRTGELMGIFSPFSQFELAFRLGIALYLSDQTEAALRWFVFAIDLGIDDGAVRLRWEPIEGAVLALVELERFDEAEQLVSRLTRTGELSSRHDNYQGFIDWRRGRVPKAIASSPRVPDLTRYWSLEFRRERGESESELLPDVELEAKISSETLGLVLALEADLIRSANPSRALTLCRAAQDWLERSQGKYVAARSHADLLRARCPEAEGFAPRS